MTKAKTSKKKGQSEPKPSLHEESQATIKRLGSIDPGLRRLLKNAHGYAVFPAVGKAAAVIGGAYGHGEVYEKGRPIGYATLKQLTIGVQLGGDTFSELIVFENRQSLERFKQGKVAFAANASAVLVKAGAAATTNFEKGAKTFVYSEGGMLLELGLGGQKFSFKPEGQKAGGKAGRAQGSSQDEQGEGEDGEQDEDSDQEDDDSEGSSAVGMASKAVGVVREHPVLSALIGAGLAAGAFFAVSRFMQGGADDSSDESSEDSEEDDEQEEDDDEGAQASSRRDDDEEEDESEDEDESDEQEDDEDEDTEARGSKDDEEDEEEDDEDEEDEEDEEPASSRRSKSSRW